MGMRDVFSTRSRYVQEELAVVAALGLGAVGQRNILVAVDGDESSLRAAAYAIGLARRQALSLVVLFVHTFGSLGSTFGGNYAMRIGNAETAIALRDEMERQAAAFGVAITVIEREGDPYVETARLAGLLRVDGVVIGSARSFGHQLFGSPAARLVRHAQWPITVVP
jgi:nucleotide-binding universal stress UspA family protein